MEVKILKETTETVVMIEGRVDTVTAPELHEQVSPLWNERIILSTHKMVTAKGGKFILRHLTAEVRSVFELTGFSRILTIQ